MKKLLALSIITSSVFTVNNPAHADITVKTGTKIMYSNAVPIENHEEDGVGGYIFTSDYSCSSTITSGSLNGGIITNQACINEIIKSGSNSTIEIAPNVNNANVEIGSGANPTTISQKGISVEGGNLLKKNTDGSVQIGGDTDDIDIVSDGLNIDGAAVITKNADGSIQIGADGNDIDITAEGLNVDGNPLITQKENGEIHIGKNSLITKREEETLPDGRTVQPLYAEDKDGNRIPINIDGSKLLIDGVEVIAGGDNAQVTTNKNNISTNTSNIKNLGEGVAGSTALTAALSALPQTSKESKLSCGVGTGAYSSRYAVGFGCASKVNERVDINAGGSYVFGGSKSYGGGTLDSGVIKAGFVFKLGELNKTTQISMKEKKELKKEISVLKENNENILTKNQKLENKVFTLVARLERLEKIALSETTSKDVAVYKLK